MSDGYYIIAKGGVLATEVGTSNAELEQQAAWSFERTERDTGLLFDEIECGRGVGDLSALYLGANGEMPTIPPGTEPYLHAYAYFRHPGSV